MKNDDRAFIVTIDGPAGSGKSSVSRSLALQHGWKWVSTGIFYRGLAYMALSQGVSKQDESGLVDLLSTQNWKVTLEHEQTSFWFADTQVTSKLHGEEVGGMASAVSQFARVRELLLGFQRDCAMGIAGLVAEGRDCGTIVFPQASVKIYLTANEDSRAIRRAHQERANVIATTEAQKARDNNDLNRKVAPLKMAEGAHLIDTSDLDLKQVVAAVNELVVAEMKASGK